MTWTASCFTGRSGNSPQRGESWKTDGPDPASGAAAKGRVVYI